MRIRRQTACAVAETTSAHLFLLSLGRVIDSTSSLNMIVPPPRAKPVRFVVLAEELILSVTFGA